MIEEPLERVSKYLTYFESVGELRTGSDVRLSGVSVGKVEKVSLAGNRVEVELSISKDVILKKDSIASIILLIP